MARHDAHLNPSLSSSPWGSLQPLDYGLSNGEGNPDSTSLFLGTVVPGMVEDLEASLECSG